jgi:hypothetical protein
MSNRLVSVLTTLTVAVCVAAILTVEPEPPTASASAAVVRVPVDPALDARGQELAGRIAYKEALIDTLIDGRATLAQVSDEFLRINEEDRAIMFSIRNRYPEASGDEERSANNVISFVRVRSLPAEVKSRVLDRLEREFEDRFGSPPVAER